MSNRRNIGCVGSSQPPLSDAAVQFPYNLYAKFDVQAETCTTRIHRDLMSIKNARDLISSIALLAKIGIEKNRNVDSSSFNGRAPASEDNSIHLKQALIYTCSTCPTSVFRTQGARLC